jgi:protein gp37
MGENTNIEWCDSSFNPWWGCEEVSPACDKCYARSWAHRLGMDGLWEGERRFFGDAHWREPLKWARQAKGRRPRVFCASMADVFDNHPAVTGSRLRLWQLIEQTPELDWLLLTKRIGNAKRMLPMHWLKHMPRHVWLGISAVTQEEAERDIWKLVEIPAAVRFISFEPLLEPIVIGLDAINWIVVGGESGGRARPMQPDWARVLLASARRSNAAFFMKQGSQANWSDFKNFDSFPEDLRVREWPEVDRS